MRWPAGYLPGEAYGQEQAEPALPDTCSRPFSIVSPAFTERAEEAGHPHKHSGWCLPGA
jgi:hypothetical protein